MNCTLYEKLNIASALLVVVTAKAESASVGEKLYFQFSAKTRISGFFVLIRLS